MNNNTPSGAISLDELNSMPGMEMPAGPSPLDDIAANPSLNSTTPTVPTAPTVPTTPVMPTTPTVSATDPMTAAMPTAPVQESEPIVVPTEAEATEASPNIAGGGAIDLSELAKMTDAAFDTMAAANTDAPTDENIDSTSPSAEAQHTLTEEEIAANEAQARAASEASLAEASTSMQNMHQNIMADVKPKEKEEVAQASIASKSRRRVKISKKAIIIAIIVIILLAGGGALAYFIVSGAFHTKAHTFGNWTVKIDESAYNVENSDALKLTAKDGSFFINYSDIGELDHAGLLKDSSGMKSMFAEDGYKIESSKEEINGVVACAVYKLIDRNQKNNIVYTAYCNIGENMISITAGANSTDEGAARSAFDKSIDIIRNAKRK